MTTSFKEILKDITAIVSDPAMRQRILDKAGKALAALVSAYPPEGPWNKNPGTRGDGRWYQRGFGSRWMRKGGSIGGTPYFSGIGGNNNSQELQKSWKIEKRDEFTAAVFTNVTYAPFLFDPDRRVSWANGHGWKDLDEFENGFAPIFEEIVIKEIDGKID